MFAQAVEYDGADNAVVIQRALRTGSFLTVLGSDVVFQREQQLVATNTYTRQALPGVGIVGFSAQYVQPATVAGAVLVFPAPSWALRTCQAESRCRYGRCRSDGSCACDTLYAGPTCTVELIPAISSAVVTFFLLVVGLIGMVLLRRGRVLRATGIAEALAQVEIVLAAKTASQEREATSFRNFVRKGAPCAQRRCAGSETLC